MGLINTYNILSNASYDSNLIQILGSTFKLKLQEVNTNFTENFDNDTGHTYDSDLVEFKDSKIEQKSQIDALCGANFNTDINLEDWSGGVVTGTAYNGAGITSGQLDLSGSENKYIDFDANNNADAQQQGCIEFDWIPKYSGAGSFQYLPTIVQAAGNANNRIRIYHQSTLLFVAISDSTGGSIVSFAESFSPITDTKYKISLNWDITNGATRLFVDGNQLGSTQTGTGIRSSNIGLLRIGKDLNGNGNANFLIDNLVIYDSVQHTSNYTPSSDDIPKYKYVTSSDILPKMQYIGDGTIKLFNSLSLVYIGSPKILLDIGESGNNLYWNGSTWAVSDNSYSQSTDLITFNINADTLPVDEETEGRFTIVFPDSNTLSSVSELTANMRIEQYSTTNPKLSFTDTFDTEALLTFLSTFSQSGNDNITFTIVKDNVERYYNSGWMVSNGIYSQSNTLTEIQNNLSTFFNESELGSHVSVNVFFHSDTGISSPTLTDITITYDFVEIDIDSIDTTIVYGFISDYQTGSKENKTVTAILNKKQVKYKDNIIYEREFFLTTTRSNGYWELALPDTENMTEGSKYIFNINGDIYIRKVPAPTITEGSKTFWELSN
jgi:hypothetical protein